MWSSKFLLHSSLQSLYILVVYTHTYDTFLLDWEQPHLYGKTLCTQFVLLVSDHFVCRSAKVIEMYRREPKGAMKNSYYPPRAKFNILLQQLRYLGIYHDEHLVSMKVFCDILVSCEKYDWFPYQGLENDFYDSVCICL